MSFPQQEVLSAPFTRQTVRRAHGLRSAAHSTLFTQPPTALSPQVSVSASVDVCIIRQLKITDINDFCALERIHVYQVSCVRADGTWIQSFLIYWQQLASASSALSDAYVTLLQFLKSFEKVSLNVEYKISDCFRYLINIGHLADIGSQCHLGLSALSSNG